MRLITLYERCRGAILLACAAPIILGAALYAFHDNSTLSKTSLSYMHGLQVNVTEAETYWRAYIRDRGSAAARQELIRQGTSIDPSQAHVLAHSFGAALYKERGITSFSFCPDKFIWGCYHQFIGIAITELGSKATETLNSECNRKSLEEVFTCLHGLGHGLVGYFGYTFADLEKALGTCRSLDPTHSSNGCADGVFMEFNIRELASLDTDGHFVPRQFSSDTPYAPCNSVVGPYQTACVFELPDWWLATMPESQENVERFSRVGELCRSIDIDATLPRTCFKGLGRIASEIADYDIKKTRLFCTVATKNAEERLVCLSAAARRFKVANVDENLTNVCVRLGLSGEAVISCSAYVPSDPLL